MCLLIYKKIDDSELAFRLAVSHLLQTIFTEKSFVNQNTDYVAKILKNYYSTIKEWTQQDPVQLIVAKLIGTTLPMIVDHGDESHCKVLEWSLKVAYRVGKRIGFDFDPSASDTLRRVLTVAT